MVSCTQELKLNVPLFKIRLKYVVSYNPFGYHGFGVNARLIYRDKVYVVMN